MQQPCRVSIQSIHPIQFPIQDQIKSKAHHLTLQSMQYGSRIATRSSYTLRNALCNRSSGIGSSNSSIRRRNLLTLAIETSCDDTCVAILEKRSHLDKPLQASIANYAKLHFHEKITARNNGHGGIHPLEALDSHQSNLAKLVTKSIGSLPDANKASLDVKTIVSSDGKLKQKPDFISVTRGPGMRSNLSCGLNTAKGLAVAWQIPLLGVHHMQAHALTPRLVHALDQEAGKTGVVPEPAFPFLTLLVSGGHTMLLHSTNLTNHKVLATTADVAIGDSLDKCGRLLLPDELKNKIQDNAYGKYLSQYAFPSPDTFESWHIPRTRREEIDRPANKYGWNMHVPFSDTKELAFNFASIATRAERIYADRTAASETKTTSDAERLLLARTVLGSAFEHLGSRIIIILQALRQRMIEIPTLVVSGGVAANDFLRWFLRSMLDVRGFEKVQLVFPPVDLCTDNAAMIAWTGMEMYEAGFQSDLGIESIRKWSMNVESGGAGGVLGVNGWIHSAL